MKLLRLTLLASALLALAPGPPGALVSAVDTDPSNGDLWIGTLGAGLFRSSAGRFDQFTQFNSGLAGDALVDVAVWGGRVFSATAGGISAFDPESDTWSLYFERRADAAPTVIVELAVVPGPAGGAEALYAAAFLGPCYRYDPGTDAWIVAPAPAGWAERIARKRRAAAVGGVAPGPAPGARPPAIGLLVPMAKPISLPGDEAGPSEVYVDRLAVEAALTRAGAPFELSSPAFQFERYGWGTTEDSLSILALRPEVAGVVGHLGPGPHFSQVLAARLDLPLVDAAPEGPAGETGADGDWVFRCASYATTGQAALLEALLAARPRAHPRWAVLRTPESASARRLDFWMRRARERGNPVATVVDWDPESGDPGPALAKLRAAKIDALFTWSDARTSALLLRRLREAGLRAAFVGSGQIVSEEFAQLAPAGAGRVLAPAPCLHSLTPESANPESLYERSFAAAAHLLTAIGRAGPDRRAVRDALRRLCEATVVEFDHGVWRALPRNEAAAN